MMWGVQGEATCMCVYVGGACVHTLDMEEESGTNKPLATIPAFSVSLRTAPAAAAFPCSQAQAEA